MRLYAYLYHLSLTIFLLGLATVAVSSSRALHLEMMPWKGDDLSKWLLWSAIFGLLSVLLAVTGVFRYLFPLWALAVVVLMVRGYLLQPYTFEGKDTFYRTLWLIGGALLAFLASLTLLRRRRVRL